MKFMNMKRFASTIMAGVMTLSLAVPAFAEDTTPKGQVTITGTYQDIPIAVDVPTTGTAQINPYGLPVTVTKSDGKTVSLVGQKVTTQPLSIKNQGATKLDVDATLAVVPAGDVSIKGGALVSGTDKGKEINVQLEVAKLDDAALVLAPDAEKLPDLLIDKFADDATWDEATTLTAPAAAKGDTAADVTPSKSADNTSPLAVLGAVTPKSDSYTYSKDSIALFRLAGELNTEPVKAGATASDPDVEDPWKAADGFTATIVFKFKPHQDVEASISLDKTTSALTTGSEVLTASFDAGDTDLTVTSWAWATSDATVANTNTTNTNATATVAYVGAGTATITVTATLSDNTTRTANCVYTNT